VIRSLGKPTPEKGSFTCLLAYLLSSVSLSVNSVNGSGELLIEEREVQICELFTSRESAALPTDGKNLVLEAPD
jgi:hypothetical protein